MHSRPSPENQQTHHTHTQSQQRRIQELERINIDLERRLEQQARERMKIERESAENKRQWEGQHAEIGRVCIDTFYEYIHIYMCVCASSVMSRLSTYIFFFPSQ